LLLKNGINFDINVCRAAMKSEVQIHNIYACSSYLTGNIQSPVQKPMADDVYGYTF
jgi:hypothetical protein